MGFITGLQSKGGIIQTIRFNDYRIVRAYVGDQLVFDHYVYDLQIKSSLLMDYLSNLFPHTIDNTLKLTKNICNINTYLSFSPTACRCIESKYGIPINKQILFSTQNAREYTKSKKEINISRSLFFDSLKSKNSKTFQKIPFIKNIKISKQVKGSFCNQNLNFFTYFNFIPVRKYHWEINNKINILNYSFLSSPNKYIIPKNLEINLKHSEKLIKNTAKSVEFINMFNFNHRYAANAAKAKKARFLNNIFITDEKKIMTYHDSDLNNKIQLNFNHYQSYKILSSEKGKMLNNILFNIDNVIILNKDNFKEVKKYSKELNFKKHIFISNNKITKQIKIANTFSIKNKIKFTSPKIKAFTDKYNLFVNNFSDLSKIINKMSTFKNEYNLFVNNFNKLSKTFNNINISKNKYNISFNRLSDLNIAKCKQIVTNTPLQFNYFVTFQAIPKTSRMKETLNLSSFAIFNKDVIIFDDQINIIDLQNINTLNARAANSICKSENLKFKTAIELNRINDFFKSIIFFNLKNNIKMQIENPIETKIQKNQQFNIYQKISKPLLKAYFTELNMQLSDSAILTSHDFDICIKKDFESPKSYSKLKANQGKILTQINNELINKWNKLQIYDFIEISINKERSLNIISFTNLKIDEHQWSQVKTPLFKLKHTANIYIFTLDKLGLKTNENILISGNTCKFNNINNFLPSEITFKANEILAIKPNKQKIGIWFCPIQMGNSLYIRQGYEIDNSNKDKLEVR